MACRIFHKYIRSADAPAGKDSDHPSCPADQNGSEILHQTGHGRARRAARAVHTERDPGPELLTSFLRFPDSGCFPPELRQSSTRSFPSMHQDQSFPSSTDRPIRRDQNTAPYEMAVRQAAAVRLGRHFPL